MTVSAAANAMPFALDVFKQDWNDPAVEDIFVCQPGAYFVRKAGVTTRHVAPELDALTVEAIAAYAGHMRGQYADSEWPILDCEMPTGERLNIVLPPCTPDGCPSMALRRASAVLPSLDELDEQGLWSAFHASAGMQGKKNGLHREQMKLGQEMLDAGRMTEFFRFGVRSRWSFAFVGETGSGKTHDATAVVMEIPLEDRLVTVADSDEWGRLPHANRVNFLFSKNGPVNAEMLIEAALRNAPRWLLVQEVRGREAFAYLRALASGHPGITTWHARSAERAFDALSPMVRQHPAGARLPEDALRAMMASFIDVVVHVERQADGQFRATDVRFGQECA